MAGSQTKPPKGLGLRDKQKPSPRKPDPVPIESLVLTPRQIRTRVRRRGYMLEEEREALRLMSEEGLDPATGLPLAQSTHRELNGAQVHANRSPVSFKPVKDWDMEELSRGRPRHQDGSFRGHKPTWVTQEIHQEALDRLKDGIRTGLRTHAVRAIEVLGEMLDSQAEDHRGRPLVPAAAKIDVAKFLVEHLVGKPVQPIQNDISIKLQGVLAAVLVQPDYEIDPVTGAPRLLSGGNGPDGVGVGGGGYQIAASHQQPAAWEQAEYDDSDPDSMDIPEAEIIHTRASPQPQQHRSFVRTQPAPEFYPDHDVDDLEELEI